MTAHLLEDKTSSFDNENMSHECYFDTCIISEISIWKSDNLERTISECNHVLFILSLSLFEISMNSVSR